MREHDMKALRDRVMLQKGEAINVKNEDEDLAQRTAASGEMQKDRKKARVAGGHKDEYRTLRDRQSATLGIMAALASRLASR
mmetsp:Transcript_39433/g.91923  ORF Transcript_39433/g.91923 Transcript_39433/m.91923 type:complete len:82 (+) Transcript_39433:1-246(+)